MFGTILDDRTIGSSGLAIGTHLALESLFYKKLELYDNERVFEKIDINNYKYHVYNLYTIVRNLSNACLHKNKQDIILHSKFINLLAQEVHLISELYKDTKCKPILFLPDYTKVYKGYNVDKETATTNPYVEHMLIRNMLSTYDKQNMIKSINDGKGYLLPKLNGNILITTNIPVDLFNKQNITLLESHTGKLKSKYEFNTKYHNVGKIDMSHLPYIEELMYILGDKNIVVPTTLSIRRELMEISVKHNWTVKTTRMKVRSDINKYPNIHNVLKNFKPMYMVESKAIKGN